MGGQIRFSSMASRIAKPRNLRIIPDVPSRGIDFAGMKQAKWNDIKLIPEVADRMNFLTKVKSDLASQTCLSSLTNSGLSKADICSIIDSGMLTYLLHCEARIASYVGEGFYTIGPCGEELLAAVSLNLEATDPVALHYRHVATSLCRQLREGKTIQDLALDRARGYTCSTLDPVTGGKHCAIGGTEYDFLVTSTLASQAPPAVGRAIGVSLAQKLLDSPKFSPNAISYVSVGDGSVNNAHFLAAVNLAKYAQHRNLKCPVVFAVSNNDKCISLKGHGYLGTFLKDVGMRNVVADGSNMADVYTKSKDVIDYSRRYKKPSMLVLQNLPRRFGHAATDRQFAYMNQEEINGEIGRNPLAGLCAEAIAAGIMSESEIEDRYNSIQDSVETAFTIAINEPKIDSRDALVASNSRPLQPRESKDGSDSPNIAGTLYASAEIQSAQSTSRNIYNVEFQGKKINMSGGGQLATKKGDVMRKNMTKVFDEIISGSDSVKNTEGSPSSSSSKPSSDVVYFGEDVEHGGYYLVTDGLVAKHGERVRDFPPDETSLIGAGIGYAQAGFTPIVEIPYSKYLDCAADMFNEAIILNWLSNGRQPAGMVVRLQGFDKGVFGGNFHTHNTLSIPPGLDVVCYSNGYDYARGMRYATRQARGGRIVMSVDSTALLNRRHLEESCRDEFCLRSFPAEGEELSFDEIVTYKCTSDAASAKPNGELPGVPSAELLALREKYGNKQFAAEKERIAVITYGNGVPTAMLAAKTLSAVPNVDITVVDSPYLTHPPEHLKTLLRDESFDRVVFADVCKVGTGMPLAPLATVLQNEGLLDTKWRVIGASNTYNPLGNTITFLSTEDIIKACVKQL